jgi:NADPH-dependent curcumin reductase CurA
MAGDLKFQVDVQEGFENIPTTLRRLYTGENHGKQLLKLGDPS